MNKFGKLVRKKPSLVVILFVFALCQVFFLTVGWRSYSSVIQLSSESSSFFWSKSFLSNRIFFYPLKWFFSKEDSKPHEDSPLVVTCAFPVLSGCPKIRAVIKLSLALVLLSIIIWHSHQRVSTSQITWCRFVYKFMANIVDSDQMFFFEKPFYLDLHCLLARKILVQQVNGLHYVCL